MWFHFCRLLWASRPPLPAPGWCPFCDGLMVAKQIPGSSLKPEGPFSSCAVFSFCTWSAPNSSSPQRYKSHGVYFTNIKKKKKNKNCQPCNLSSLQLSIDHALWVHSNPEQSSAAAWSWAGRGISSILSVSFKLRLWLWVKPWTSNWNNHVLRVAFDVF